MCKSQFTEVKTRPLPAAITDSTHPPLTLYMGYNTMEAL